MNDIEKLEKLIEKGNEVLRTHRPNPPNVIGFPTLDSKAFSAWQTQCLNFLENRLPPNSPYVRAFKEKIQKGYQGTVKAGIGILEAVKEDLDSTLTAKTSILAISEKQNAVKMGINEKRDIRFVKNVVSRVI
ncbi:MAG: hypothetical protein LWW94_11290 [Candidatus Desulfofervidaceae bacterium]|nr:hypothetical protein [Candidatus Desulfofervidaceae bacterium]